MNDGIIKQDGTSRLVKASFPATYEEFRTMASNGTLTMDILFNAVGWQQIPTFLNKANLLPDDLTSFLGISDSSVPADAYKAIPPAGSIFWFAGKNAPNGYLICDGSAVLKVDYPKLYAVLGSTFGEETETQFYLPNLSAAFIRGSGSQNGYSATFGQAQEATYVTLGASASYGNADKTDSEFPNYANSGSGASVRNIYVRPFNIALTPIIKY